MLTDAFVLTAFVSVYKLAKYSLEFNIIIVTRHCIMLFLTLEFLFSLSFRKIHSRRRYANLPFLFFNYHEHTHMKQIQKQKQRHWIWIALFCNNCSAAFRKFVAHLQILRSLMVLWKQYCLMGLTGILLNVQGFFKKSQTCMWVWGIVIVYCTVVCSEWDIFSITKF